jgi:hypothetical protein
MPTDWAMTPAELRGVVNDAVAIQFLDATWPLPSAPGSTQCVDTPGGAWCCD